MSDVDGVASQRGISVLDVAEAACVGEECLGLPRLSGYRPELDPPCVDWFVGDGEEGRQSFGAWTLRRRGIWMVYNSVSVRVI